MDVITRLDAFLMAMPSKIDASPGERAATLRVKGLTGMPARAFDRIPFDRRADHERGARMG